MKRPDIQKNIIKHQFKITKEDREKLNNQKGIVLWFVGLSGSGKSTIANEVDVFLHQQGFRTYILDGDNTRKGINQDLDFTDDGRKENIRRVSEICNLFVDAGLMIIASFISPFQEDRENAKKLIGEENFVEIFVDCPVEVCEQRDVKGLYAKARRGEILNFTGINSPFEAPKEPSIHIHSDKESLCESMEKIIDYLKQHKIISQYLFS